MKIIITQQQFYLIVESKSKKIDCEMCDHSWDIEPKDKHPFLCHDCGYDNKTKKYNKQPTEKILKLHLKLYKSYRLSVPPE